MDGDRAQNFKDPNEIFINAPEGGASGFSEMNFMGWLNRKIAALYHRLKARSAR